MSEPRFKVFLLDFGKAENMGSIVRGPWSKSEPKMGSIVLPNDEIEYVSFDLETTGLYKSDKIVEIAFVAFKGDRVLDEWSTLINPMRDVGKTDIHGISASMVSTAPIFEEIVNDVFRMINNRILVSHNYSFDIRMLLQEFGSLGVEGDFGKGFCTMIASRRLLPGVGESLKATCEGLSIKAIDSHSALGDARMAMQIFSHLQEDNQDVIAAKVNYQKNKKPARTVVREAFKASQNDAIEKIKKFTSKIPFPTSDEKGVAYLLILNMALQDFIVSKNEEAELKAWAENLGISDKERDDLHRGYLDSFIQAALRDGVITVREREMIDLVGKALKLKVEIPDTPQPIKVNAENLSVGKRICFTGEAVGLSGESISRSELEALASKVGLHPVKDVTKKGCDALVAADVSSMSGKAKKAKEWGIPVLSVDQFISYCTFGK